MKVGIIGYGWVGKAMHRLFPDAAIYDSFIDKFSSETSKEQVNACDIVFIGVPTPNKPVEKIGQELGELDTSIVEEVISWCEASLLVVRSTVNPGDCDRWYKKYNKSIVMQPEYLGETPSHPFLDPRTRQFLIIGGSPENRLKLINLYTTVYNANILIRQVTKLEAEVIKLTENRAIGEKVGFCQELYDVIQKANASGMFASTLDYYEIVQAVYGDDPRFNLWFTFVFPDKRGFNSKCIPKDIYAWCAWAESCGYDPKITRALLNKNKEWISQS